MDKLAYIIDYEHFINAAKYLWDVDMRPDDLKWTAHNDTASKTYMSMPDWDDDDLEGFFQYGDEPTLNIFFYYLVTEGIVPDIADSYMIWFSW